MVMMVVTKTMLMMTMMTLMVLMTMVTMMTMMMMMPLLLLRLSCDHLLIHLRLSVIVVQSDNYLICSI